MENLLSHCLSICVGGMCFEVKSEHLPIDHTVDDSYRHFTFSSANNPTGEVIPVQICVKDIDQVSGETIFDAGSWRIVAWGENRALVFQLPNMSRPLYVARFHPTSRRVEFICSPLLVESEGGAPRVQSQFRYPLDQVLAMYFLSGQGLIVHAAGFIQSEKGLIFAGVSGAGKSTLTRLARHWAGALPLSDDRVILRTQDDGVYLYGTPWPGEAGVAQNRQGIASALLFLEKGSHNATRPISRRETLARLLPTVSLPWYDPPVLSTALQACDAILRQVPAFVFTFRPEAEAIDVLDTFVQSL